MKKIKIDNIRSFLASRLPLRTGSKVVFEFDILGDFFCLEFVYRGYGYMEKVPSPSGYFNHHFFCIDKYEL